MGDAIRYQADDRHGDLILKFLGLNRSARALSQNGDRIDHWDPSDDEVLPRDEAPPHTGV